MRLYSIVNNNRNIHDAIIRWNLADDNNHHTGAAIAYIRNQEALLTGENGNI